MKSVLAWILSLSLICRNIEAAQNFQEWLCVDLINYSDSSNPEGDRHEICKVEYRTKNWWDKQVEDIDFKNCLTVAQTNYAAEAFACRLIFCELENFHGLCVSLYSKYDGKLASDYSGFNDYFVSQGFHIRSLAVTFSYGVKLNSDEPDNDWFYSFDKDGGSGPYKRDIIIGSGLSNMGGGFSEIGALRAAAAQPAEGTEDWAVCVTLEDNSHGPEEQNPVADACAYKESFTTVGMNDKASAINMYTCVSQCQDKGFDGCSMWFCSRAQLNGNCLFLMVYVEPLEYYVQFDPWLKNRIPLDNYWKEQQDKKDFVSIANARFNDVISSAMVTCRKRKFVKAGDLD